MELRFSSQVMGPLEGAIDIHIHSEPDVHPTILDGVGLALAQGLRDLSKGAMIKVYENLLGVEFRKGEG